MASGSIAGQEINGQKAYLFWSYTQNIANRTTTITFTFKVKRVTSTYLTWQDNVNVYIEAPDGTDIYNVSTYDYDIRSIGVGSYLTICSASKTFTHNTAGVLSPVTCDAGVDLSDVSVGEYLNATGSISVANIPVGSEIGSVTGLVIGSNMTVPITTLNSAYTHTLQYEWQGTLETIATGVTGSSPSATFLLDNALANYIPNSSSGTMQLICKTYSGATLLGTKTKDVTISVPSTMKPTITTFAGATSGDAVSVAWNKFIKGKSKINFTWAGVAGIYGSTIVSWAITATGFSYTGASTATSGSKLSDLVNFVGALTFTLSITDSRGKVGTKTLVITGVDYASPVVTSFSASRGTGGTKNDDGTQIITSQVFTYSTCGGSNTLTVKKVNIMQLPSGAWGADNAVVTAVDKICTGTFSADLSWYVRITITDAYGSVYAYATVQPSFSILEIYGATGKGLAVGKKATLDETFEVDLATVFNKAISGTGLDLSTLTFSYDIPVGVLAGTANKGTYAGAVFLGQVIDLVFVNGNTSASPTIVIGAVTYTITGLPVVAKIGGSANQTYKVKKTGATTLAYITYPNYESENGAIADGDCTWRYVRYANGRVHYFTRHDIGSATLDTGYITIETTMRMYYKPLPLGHNYPVALVALLYSNTTCEDNATGLFFVGGGNTTGGSTTAPPDVVVGRYATSAPVMANNIINNDTWGTWY